MNRVREVEMAKGIRGSNEKRCQLWSFNGCRGWELKSDERKGRQRRDRVIVRILSADVVERESLLARPTGTEPGEGNGSVLGVRRERAASSLEKLWVV